ncbi:8-oxo-dGTP diphosphatase [Haloferula chungangensis]|uniref:Oxidized purine nucleoside triphosphate hydrolase n=1 Tax=Haloferula chungangensis TaxID=1048331 RepID=A0ABW2L7Q6_9BACT
MESSNVPSPLDWGMWRAHTHATLMFIIKDGKILLIEKKRGLGAGKINGPGGKIDPGETPLQCAIRETQEELLITALGPRKIGELHFAMSDVPDILCHVYVAHDFEGVPTETDEAKPRWFRLEDIPYSQMWSDDVHWIPLMLSDRTFLGRFAFSDEEVAWFDVEEGVGFPSEG